MKKQLAAALLAVTLSSPAFATEVATPLPVPPGQTGGTISWTVGGVVILYMGAVVYTHYKYCAANPKCYNAQRDGLPR